MLTRLHRGLVQIKWCHLSQGALLYTYAVDIKRMTDAPRDRLSLNAHTQAHITDASGERNVSFYTAYFG